MKKNLLVALCTLSALPLGACADGYGYGGVSAGIPYAYNGYYDDFYGPVYDGYWGDDGGFYYRSTAHDRRYRRGDSAHFSHGARPDGHFHEMRGSMTPERGMRTPHFSRGGTPGEHHRH
ncbi:hypothetical protein GCM10009087_54560 [Sphingomonas oligophenolica]|uniref:Lipoprotein n=1 Tax=Sphingomonas oligophenolica TaxID=301154 RepID=A0ABU9Y564_9SPHN